MIGGNDIYTYSAGRVHMQVARVPFGFFLLSSEIHFRFLTATFIIGVKCSFPFRFHICFFFRMENERAIREFPSQNRSIENFIHIQ